MLDVGSKYRRSSKILVYNLDLELKELIKLYNDSFGLLGY
jgi:hypothetical protein